MSTTKARLVVYLAQPLAAQIKHDAALAGQSVTTWVVRALRGELPEVSADVAELQQALVRKEAALGHATRAATRWEAAADQLTATLTSVRASREQMATTLQRDLQDARDTITALRSKAARSVQDARDARAAAAPLAARLTALEHELAAARGASATAGREAGQLSVALAEARAAHQRELGEARDVMVGLRTELADAHRRVAELVAAKAVADRAVSAATVRADLVAGLERDLTAARAATETLRKSADQLARDVAGWKAAAERDRLPAARWREVERQLPEAVAAMTKPAAAPAKPVTA